MALFRVTAGGVYLARSAVVTSEVLIGAQSSLWFNVVVRGDVAPISIGRRVNVQDNCVVHCDFGKPLVIEDDVSIGHSAVVHGLLVGAGSLVGMHATLLGGTRVGRGCLVAAGAVVPPGMSVPDGMMCAGVPARVIRPVKPEEATYMRWLSGHYATLAARYANGDLDAWNESAGQSG